MFALDILNQLQNENGTLLSNGRIYVYYLGRTRLADIYNDIDGQIPLPNPVILDNLGMSEIYLSNAYDYTVVVTDPYGTELFSRDIFTSPLQEGGANARLYEGWDPIVVNNNVNVISAKMATFGVESPLYFAEDSESATVIGISGELGKTYSGIDPIVVNNELNKISANTKTLSAETPLYITDYEDKTVISVQSAVLGVEEPLYFVENSETATVIGIQGSAITPEGTMNESAFGYEDGKITGYNGSGFSAGGEYVVGNNETGFAITSQSGFILVGENEHLSSQAIGITKSDSGIWLSPNRIELYAGSALNETLDVLDISALKELSASKLDASSFSSISGDWLTTADSANFYTTDNPSGFVTNSEVTNNYINYSAISGEDGKVTAINGSALSAGLTYSGIDPIVVNNEEAKISANTIDVLGVSPIEVVEYNDVLVISANMSSYASNSALSSKLDTSSFSSVSGDFLTAIPDEYATKDYVISSVSSKLDVSSFSSVSGDYLTTADSGNFATTGDLSDLVTSISETYQSTAGMTAYQSALTFSYDSLDNISAINNSGITMTPSRDLYVKEPLYTGMTGTSAYIGVYESAIQPLVFGYTAIGE